MDFTQKKSYPWILVLIYSLLGICLPSTVTQFTMLVNTIAKEMNVSEQTVLLADTFRAICLVCSLFASSYFYKKFGLKKTIMLGLFCQILPQFILPIGIEYKNIFILYLFKGMQGMNALAFPLYLSTIVAWIDEKSKGLATSVFNGGFTAGAGLGAWISGKVIPLLGWKMSFYVLGFLCIFFAIPVLLISKDKEEMRSSRNLNGDKTNRYHIIFKQKITWMLVFALLAYTWIAQAITVDMSIYSTDLGYSYNQIGTLMLIISIVTVISSILGGAVSDIFALKSDNKLKSRIHVLLYGYIISAISAFMLPFVAIKGFIITVLLGSMMMFGVSWAQGVYWAIPSEIYKAEDNVIATSICSGASNLVNPIAPLIVGVVFGTRGFWHLGWLTCSIISIFSILSAIMVLKLKK